MFTTTCDWKVPDGQRDVHAVLRLARLSAALWGGWLERAGPRKAGVVAALCWGGGLVLGGVGVMIHQLWLLWLGSGVIGGIGLGLGYISPVSTLIKWFPDRRGMATGMAIMGFGGGAMIGAPLADMLMKHFGHGEPAPACRQTSSCMGVVYFVFMTAGAFGFRIAPAGWQPERLDAASDAQTKAMITRHHVHLDEGLEDAAVLADLGGAVPERLGRHRRDRHGLADAAGDFRRHADRASASIETVTPDTASGHRRRGGRVSSACQPVQQPRPLLLGLAVGPDRAQDHLFRRSSSSASCSTAAADARATWALPACSSRRSA